jgi:hypothetical protein
VRKAVRGSEAHAGVEVVDETASQVDKAASQTGEAASQVAGEASSSVSGVASRGRPEGGGGGHGKRGSSGESEGSTSGGGPRTEGTTAPSGTGEGAGTKQSASAAPTSAPTPAAVPASAPTPAPKLAPQLAAVVTQRSSRAARRAGTRARGTRRSAAFEATLPAASFAASEGRAASAPAAAAVHPAASRTRAPTPASSNLLEGIGRHIPLPIPVPDWVKTVIVALFMLAIWLAIRASLEGARARRLERQRVGLLRDVGTMQAALVPDVPHELGGLDVSVAYRPAEGPAAGGDFYDLFVPRAGVVAFMLGDVAGHGPEALNHAALTRYTLRAYLQAGLEPRTALALAGRVLKDPTGERYATVAVGVYDAGEGTLSYALAGHPPPMLLGAGGVEALTACSSPPVGWGVATGRRQTTISLPAGTEACFFSDGLIEARREGQLLGRERLHEIFAGLGPRPVAKKLLEEVRAVAHGTPDDMVAVVLSPQATPKDGQVHIEELEVDAGALARNGVRRFLHDCSVPPAAIARALRLAAETAHSEGSAVLRVTFGPERTRVTVAAPESLGPRRAHRSLGARVADVSAGTHELVAAGAVHARALA